MPEQQKIISLLLDYLTVVGFQLVGTERISFHKDSEGNDIYFEGGNFVKELC